jgi:hypothetical protein
VELPERLQQLDRELCKEQSKDYDYLWATRQGLRIRICVMRGIDNKCWATAQLGSKRAFREGGGYTASGAFLMLTVRLGVAIAEMRHAEREQLKRELDEFAVHQQERDTVLKLHHSAKSDRLARA